MTGPARTLRATVGRGSRHEGDAAIAVDTPASDGTGSGVLRIAIDGVPQEIRFETLDDRHATLALGTQAGGTDAPGATRLLFGAPYRREGDGIVVREVAADGWLVEVELEPEGRAALRERARRAGAATVAGGPAELHAIIPGRIVALSVNAGDEVVPGQQLLVLEAMKMQNELRAQREGVVERVAVSVGQAVEVGDLLLVIR